MYLLVAGILSAICGLSAYFDWIPTIDLQLMDETVRIYAAAAIGFVLCALSFFTIFRYNNRPLQMKLALTIDCCATLAAIFFHIAFIAVSPFTILAWRAISADERLVRSIDRIR